MAAQPNFSSRFVRKTQLSANEYHKNFFKLDEEIITAVTSAEADKVTPLMSKIYLRLVNAPSQYWEREGVLRFECECREAGQVKAWDVLCETLGVASATANKAIAWMRDEGIIGYFAGKNGVGLRIFLNRASSSIGIRAGSSGQKILRLAPASSGARAASTDEAAFKDSYAVSEGSDSDVSPRAPKNGADTNPAYKTVPEPAPTPYTKAHTRREEAREVEPLSQPAGVLPLDEVVARLRNELEPCVKSAAAQAAAETAAREMARTREWFETKALPKAVRVAQHETYDLLRKQGIADERSRRACAGLEVGRAADCYTPPAAHKLSPEEIGETAETCVALLETQGKSIDATLSEIGSEGGGWLLPEDAPRVREAALKLLGERSERR